MSWNALGPGQTKTNKIITDSTGDKLVTLPPCKISAHADLHLQRRKYYKISGMKCLEENTYNIVLHVLNA